MVNYKRMFHTDIFDLFKGGDLINYLKRCKPEVPVMIDGEREFFIRETDSEIIFDSFPKKEYIDDLNIPDKHSEEVKGQFLPIFEKQEKEERVSLTVEGLITKLENYRDSIVLLSTTPKFYIHYFEGEQEDDIIFCIASFNAEELYEYEEPSEFEYPLIKGTRIALASSRVRGVRDDLRLKYAFDDKKVDEEFNRILENPDILNGIMKDDPTTVDRTIRAFEEFNSLSDRFKEFWMNEFIMEKAQRQWVDTLNGAV